MFSILTERDGISTVMEKPWVAPSNIRVVLLIPTPMRQTDLPETVMLLARR